MTELQIIDKDGLFHNIAKQSAIINGRYAVLAKGSQDLNMNNLLSGLDLPKDKYPGIFCLPPVSELPCTLQGGQWETFSFRVLFLTTTNYTGDNQIKSPDFNTNTSLHTIAQDWYDMKTVAFGFMNALESVQKQLRGQFRLSQQSTWRFARVSAQQNDVLSGVLAMFSVSLAADCVYEDINISAIELPAAIHPQHFH